MPMVLTLGGGNVDSATFGGEGGVPTTRTIATNAPLTGGGDLSADRTLGVSSATTASVGVVELATDGEAVSGVVVQGNDARLSNARTPTAHSIIGAEHNGFPGGTTNFLRADGTFAAPSGGSDPFIFKGVLASDVATGANITPVSLTGLVFTFLANKTYMVDFAGNVQSSAATTGHGFQLDTSVAVTQLGLTFDHQLANTGTRTGGSSIADDASVGVSTGVPTLGVNCPVMGSGILQAGVNGGTAQLRHRSEVAAVSTVKAGFCMRVMLMN